MSGVARFLTYVRQNPIAVYLAGGVVLHFARSLAVQSAYQQHFAQYDIEREREL